jgi:hypothetical protein
MRSVKTGFYVVVLVVCGLGLLPRAGLAQEAPMLTAIEGPAAGTWTPVDGAPQPLATGMLVADGRTEVTGGQRVMLLSPAGDVAIVAMGPGSFETRTDGDATVFTLLAGRLMFASTGAADSAGVRWAIRDAGAREPLAAGPVGRGWVFLACAAGGADVAFMSESEPPGTLNITVGRAAATVRSGERLSVKAGAFQPGALEPWLSENGFDAPQVGQRVGVASAQIQRPQLQKELFQHVIDWDRRAQPQEVRLQLQAQQFRPEVRALAVAVGGQVQVSTAQGSTNRPPVVAGANSVPTLSPAAIAVGGVTALENNANAQRILTITGSRGLGFGGLSRLALSGVTPGGTPATGPSGLTGR